MDRRLFMKTSALAAGATAVRRPEDLRERLEKLMTAPALKTESLKQPVKIASIELLKNGREYLARVRSTDGAEGLAAAHSSAFETTYPIFLKRVAPFFIGKDARDLEALLEGVYEKDSNYKWQG